MAITQAFSGTATIGTTEYSLTANGTFVPNTGQATDGVYQVFIDFSNMSGLDQYQIRIYERCLAGSTQQIIYESVLSGAQADLWVSPSLILIHAWDVTVDKLAGTDRSISWSIRQVA